MSLVPPQLPLSQCRVLAELQPRSGEESMRVLGCHQLLRGASWSLGAPVGSSSSVSVEVGAWECGKAQNQILENLSCESCVLGWVCVMIWAHDRVRCCPGFREPRRFGSG